MGYDYNAAASTGDSAYQPAGPAMPLPPQEPRQPRASLSEIDYRGPGNQPPGGNTSTATNEPHRPRQVHLSDAADHPRRQEPRP